MRGSLSPSLDLYCLENYFDFFTAPFFIFHFAPEIIIFTPEIFLS